MYEDLLGIKQAYTELGIVAREEIEMIFHSNAARLIAGIVARKQGACNSLQPQIDTNEHR